MSRQLHAHLTGFTPYDPAAAALYSERRWWLGLTMGDTLDKAADLYPRKEAVVGADGAAPLLVRGGARAGRRHGLSSAASRVSSPATGCCSAAQLAEFVVSLLRAAEGGLGDGAAHREPHRPRDDPPGPSSRSPRGWIVPRTVPHDRLRAADGTGAGRRPPRWIKVHPRSVDRRCRAGASSVSQHCRRPAPTRTWCARALEAARPDPGAVCQILPSGGTTGLPKGCPRTHNDYLCNVEYKSKAWDCNVTDRSWWPPPWATTWLCWCASPPAVFQGATHGA